MSKTLPNGTKVTILFGVYRGSVGCVVRSMDCFYYVTLKNDVNNEVRGNEICFKKTNVADISAKLVMKGDGSMVAMLVVVNEVACELKTMSSCLDALIRMLEDLDLRIAVLDNKLK